MTQAPSTYHHFPEALKLPSLVCLEVEKHSKVWKDEVLLLSMKILWHQFSNKVLKLQNSYIQQRPQQQQRSDRDHQLNRQQRERRPRDHDRHCHHYQRDQTDVQRNSACGIIAMDIAMQILWKLSNGNAPHLMNILIHRLCGTILYQLESLSIESGLSVWF